MDQDQGINAHIPPLDRPWRRHLLWLPDRRPHGVRWRHINAQVQKAQPPKHPPPTSGPPLAVPNTTPCTQSRASWSTGQTHNARCGVPETGGEGRLTASAWFRAPTALCISSARGSGGRPSPRRKPRERKPPSPYYDGYFVLATKCSVTGQDTRRFGFRSPQSSAVFFRARPIELACLRDAPGPRERWRAIMASTAPQTPRVESFLDFPPAWTMLLLADSSSKRQT